MFIESKAGVPVSGPVDAATSSVNVQYDTTNQQLNVYYSGSWHQIFEGNTANTWSQTQTFSSRIIQGTPGGAGLGAPSVEASNAFYEYGSQTFQIILNGSGTDWAGIGVLSADIWHGSSSANGSAIDKTAWQWTKAGSFAVGPTAALATNATDGFLYIPTCAGTPTGVPASFTGKVAMVYDTTNNKFYIYNGGWKGGTNPGTFT